MTTAATGLAGDGVRILVIGTATHTADRLTPVPSAARSARAVARALVECCGADQSSVELLIDPPDPPAMIAAIIRAAREATRTLLVYYVGHGLLGWNNDLHLAAVGTGELVPGSSQYQALPYSAVREAIEHSPAASRVLILDCCYSGRAVPPAAAPAAGTGFTPPAAAGSYLLTSAERLASAPTGQELTAFSEAFVRCLRDGDPRAPRLLTLEQLFQRVRTTLRAAGAPEPRRTVGDNTGALVLAVNPAHPDTTDDEEPEPADPGAESPYLGLEPFGEGDAHRFFGRAALVDELVRRCSGALADGVPLMLVAPSGSGKTSLLLAGLIPAIRASDGPSQVLVMQPGERPAERLTGLLGADPFADPAAAARALARADRAPRLTVVVDQFEQLFTLCDDEDERTAFLGTLAAVAREHLVVAALRADFFAAAAARPELAAALGGHQFLVPPMGTAEMRAAIEEPARSAGLHIDPGVAELVLAELGALGPVARADAARLPLLSHALWATWQRRRGGRLTVRAYQETGGVAAAVANTAEEVYGRLPEEAREALRRMLPRLVRVADDGPDTVRPLSRESLLHGLPDPIAAETALTACTAARLVTADRDTVRISHEALLVAWPRLRAWIAGDREWLRTVQRLAADADAWRQSGRDGALLYRGTRLNGAREGAAVAGREAELEASAAEFLAASQGAERRGIRIRRGLTAALATLTVAALAAATAAVIFQRQTEEQRNQAIAQVVAGHSERLRNTQPGLAKQLAIAAYEIDPTAGAGPVLAAQPLVGQMNAGEAALDLAEDGADRLLAVSTGPGVVIREMTGDRRSVTLGGFLSGPLSMSGDGRLLAAAAGPPADLESGRLALAMPDVRLWDLTDPMRPEPVATLPTGDTIAAVALSPGRRLLAAAGESGLVRVWDVADPRSPREVARLAGHRGRVDSLAFNASGRLLASAGEDATTRLWDVSDPAKASSAHVFKAERRGLLNDDVYPHRVGFDAGGTRLVTVAFHNHTESPVLWDVAAPRSPRRLADIGQSSTTCPNLLSVAVSPSSEYIVGGCSRGSLATWRYVAPDGASTRPAVLFGEVNNDGVGLGEVGALVIRPAPGKGDRTVVVTASRSGVRLWDMTNPYRIGAFTTLPMSPGGSTRDVVFSPRDRLVADTGGSHGVRVWDLADPLRPVATGGFDSVFTGADGGLAAFSPDGGLLAVGLADRSGTHVDLVRPTALAEKPLASIRDAVRVPVSVRFSPVGQFLAVSSVNYGDGHAEGVVRLYDVADPARPREVAMLPVLAEEVAFSPDGKLLAAFSATKVLLYGMADPAHPSLTATGPLSGSSTFSVGEFSPDGNLLVVAETTPFIRIFPLARGGELGDPRVLVGRNDSNTQMAISPDGRMLALAGPEDDRRTAVDFWDLSKPAAPRFTASLSAGGSVMALRFSPTGRYLAVGSEHSTSLWSTDPDVVKQALCAVAGDPITEEQWELYIPGLPYSPPC